MNFERENQQAETLYYTEGDIFIKCFHNNVLRYIIQYLMNENWPQSEIKYL